ncbi:MAG: hypothetical protein ACEPOZ_21190 [Marinifilaceae bacterium]
MKFGYIDVAKKREFWRELGEKKSGAFSIKHYASMSLESLQLNFKYNGIEVEFTESDTQPLKVKFSHPTTMKFEVSISIEDIIDKTIKLLGANREIQVGDAVFDASYLIRGEDDYVVRKFLSREIRDLMLETKVFAINCTRNRKTEKVDFILTVNRQIMDYEGLLKVYQLICLIIDQFKEIRII